MQRQRQRQSRLQRQRQPPSKRSLSVRFTHGSVFITASNLNMMEAWNWILLCFKNNWKKWKWGFLCVVVKQLKKVNQEPGLWNPDVGADGDAGKVNVRYRIVGRLHLSGAHSKVYQIVSTARCSKRTRLLSRIHPSSPVHPSIQLIAFEQSKQFRTDQSG